MGVKFFGAFLIERGVITPEQLFEALEEQKRINLKLGEHAIRLGYLTPEQVEEIRKLQKREELRFGEAAVKLGYLTPEQVEQLIRIQKSSHKLLGDILVEKGFITKEVLMRELKIFESEQRAYMTEMVYLPEGVKNRDFINIVVDLGKKFLLRTVDINTKFGDFTFEEYVKRGDYDVQVDIGGDVKMKVIFSPPQKLPELLVREYNIPDSPELRKDAVNEFMNVIMGNAVAKMERLGKRISISVPKEPDISSKCLKYNLVSPDDTYTFYFLEL
jgi:CheY-specific phosphatase CheX